MKTFIFVAFILLLASGSGFCAETGDVVRSTVKEEDKNGDGKIDSRIICTYDGQDLRSKESQLDTDYDGDFDLVFGKIYVKGQIVCSWSQDKRNKKWARSFFSEGKEVLSEGNFDSSNVVDTIVLLDTNRMPHTVLKVIADGRLGFADDETFKDFQNTYQMNNEVALPILKKISGTSTASLTETNSVRNTKGQPLE